MRIKKELNKIGITPLDKISVAEKNALIKTVVTGLINTFPNLKFNYSELAMKLYNCNMYKAKINPKFNRANYFYKNKTIYFDETLKIEEINANVIHECIHYIQDIRQDKDKLYRIGLCEFNDYKVIGLGLNEIVLQYISEKIINQNEEQKKDVLDLYVNTLLNQIFFLFGEDLIVESAINAKEDFENKFMDTFQEEEIYYKLTTTFDRILEEKQQIDSFITKNTQGEKQEISNKIENINSKIYNLFEQIQIDMFDKYFNISIKYLDTIEEVDEYKGKVLEYQKLIECYEEDREKYNKCAEKYLILLDKKIIDISIKNSRNSLMVFKNNPIMNLLRNIRKVFFKNESY